jgi:RNA polymerase sigma-70 factor (ECF subfamily)
MQSDHELIREFQQGNRAAFDQLVRRHLESVYRFFLRLTGDPMEAEDLAQDAFHRLFKALKRFRFDAAFTTYLFRINLNLANTYLRRNRWRTLLHLDQAPEPVDVGHNPEPEWSRKELWHAVVRLPRKQRLVVMMRIAQELPYKNIAQILEISEGAAKVNFHHALQTLKQQLQEETNGL